MVRRTGVRPRPASHRVVLGFNILVVVALVTAGLGLLWINGRVGQRLVVTLDNATKSDANVTEQVPRGTDWNLDAEGLDAENFLLTGSDNGSCTDPNDPTTGGIGDRTNLGERSDTIMIIRMDPSTKRAAILSFPRDLWVDIAGTTRQNRINSAFQSTDPKRLVATIEENFQVPVDHYVNVNFCAFKEIVTAVDGVKVPFLYPTRDKTTGFNVSAPGCVTFDGDAALAYVRSRSGYRYFDTTKQQWLQDPTGDLGRISRQQDFLRRSMQRALDKGSSSLSVANNLLNAALKNVITDDRLTLRDMLTLAQAMRDLNTRTVATYTIESYPKRIGGMSVLIPSIKSDTMQQILAIFQGKSPLAVQQTAMNPPNNSVASLAVFDVVTTLAPPLVELIAHRIMSSIEGATTKITTMTTIPSAPPQQDTIGVVPPNDPTCH